MNERTRSRISTPNDRANARATGRRRRAASAALVVAAVLALLPGIATLVLGAFPQVQRLGSLTTLAASFIHFGVFAWLLAALLALSAVVLARPGRKRLPVAFVAALAVAGLAVQAAWIVPGFVPANEAHEGEPLTVMTLNVEFGAEPHEVGEIIDVAKSSDADVVVLQEATPETLDALRASGFETHYPYRFGEGEAMATGTVIYARHPVEHVTTVATVLETHIVRVATPNGPLVVAGVHPRPPLGDVSRWYEEAAALREALQPHLADDLVVAGDFNAIDMHLPMQQLAGDGLRSAARLAGAGPVTTWPDDKVYPALIAIDHVLVGESLTALSFDTHSVAGTDHRAVVVEVAPRVR